MNVPMMFLNDVHKKEEIRNLALQDLRNLGIKFRPKKHRQNVQETKSRKVFKIPLQSLPMQTVTLVSGQQLIVPRLVHEMCSFILTKVYTEGLFRKGGSRSRQNEIKLSLDAGCYLGDEHHEIDVASVLKTFFRELPEPLFPSSYHDLFLRCIILPSDNLCAILLACLLLPCEHLNTLAYLMQFLNQITHYAEHNKMDAYNLAVVMGPTLLPVDEKIGPQAAYRVNKFCEVFKLLVENASAIGLVPENIIERIALSSLSASFTDDDAVSIKKKKKRRSGSLTRMLNGLKKIVTNKSVEDNINVIDTPDLLLTPCMTRSAKKRKFDGAGFSIRKKKEILDKLPQSAALNTPYTPLRTPVNINPNPQKTVTPDTRQKRPDKVEIVKEKEKKSQWLLKPKTKSSKNDDTASVTSRTSTGTRALLERRWSQVSQAAGFRKNKKRNSCGANVPNDRKTTDKLEIVPSNAVPTIIVAENCELKATPEPDYVKISRMEYEEIKNRVSEIERRISIELDTTEKTLKSDTIENVQCAYQETLEHVEPLSPTTDQLARRLSRELKIRRSAEQKIIRSPSARKIGILRRRSSERQVKLSRNRSWHISRVEEIPRVNLRRAQPIVQTRPQPIVTHVITTGETDLTNSVPPNSRNRCTTRSSSFHGDSSSVSKPLKRLSDNWKNGESFFDGSTPSFGNTEKCRASLIKLRNQNAGMVLAKAKLFDDLVDSDSNKLKSTPNLIPRVQTNKLGAARNTERQSYRIRALKAEERRNVKKNMSPRRRTCKSPNGVRQQRLQIAKGSSVALMLEEGNDKNKENNVKDPFVLGNCLKAKGSPLRDANFRDMPSFVLKNTSPCTPRAVPQIKKPFNIKSPKRLNRTPLSVDRATPLKVISNNRKQY